MLLKMWTIFSHSQENWRLLYWITTYFQQMKIFASSLQHLLQWMNKRNASEQHIGMISAIEYGSRCWIIEGEQPLLSLLQFSLTSHSCNTQYWINAKVIILKISPTLNICKLNWRPRRVYSGYFALLSLLRNNRFFFCLIGSFWISLCWGLIGAFCPML